MFKGFTCGTNTCRKAHFACGRRRSHSDSGQDSPGDAETGLGPLGVARLFTITNSVSRRSAPGLYIRCGRLGAGPHLLLTERDTLYSYCQ